MRKLVYFSSKALAKILDLFHGREKDENVTGWLPFVDIDRTIECGEEVADSGFRQVLNRDRESSALDVQDWGATKVGREQACVQSGGHDNNL